MPPTEPRLGWMRRVWERLGQCEDTRALHLYLSSALSAADRLFLLEELIENILARAGDAESPEVENRRAAQPLGQEAVEPPA